MMLIYLIVVYLMGVFVVTLLAMGRRINVGNAFAVSLFMTPIVGLLAVFKMEKRVKITRYVSRYSCPRCNAKFNTEEKYCPSCLKEGVKVHPQKIEAEFKLAG